MTATLSEGHYARRFGFAFSLCSRGNVPSTPTAFLRFRTNDVLLGTSGVGVRVSVVSNSPGIYYFYFLFFMLYRLPAGIPYHLLCLPRPDGRSASEWLPDRVCSDDPYNFFSPQAGPILLEVSPTIRSSVLRQSPGALSVFVTGGTVLKIPSIGLGDCP